MRPAFMKRDWRSPPTRRSLVAQRTRLMIAPPTLGTVAKHSRGSRPRLFAEASIKLPCPAKPVSKVQASRRLFQRIDPAAANPIIAAPSTTQTGAAGALSFRALMMTTTPLATAAKSRLWRRSPAAVLAGLWSNRA
jgi:hypothetical protein